MKKPKPTRAQKERLFRAAMSLARFVAKRDYGGSLRDLANQVTEPHHKAFLQACAAVLKGRRKR